MNRQQLEHAIRAAGAICGDRELYVVGSQCILGPYPDAHPDLCRSTEVDMAPKNHPELEALIAGSIGELSPFHKTFGFYVDGVDLRTIVLPEGWQQRTVAVETPNTNGFCGLCLDPVDLAVSKLAAGRPKDLTYVEVLVREGMVKTRVLEDRVERASLRNPDRLDELRERLRRLGPPGAREES